MGAIYTKTRELTAGVSGDALDQYHLTSHDNLDAEIDDISTALSDVSISPTFIGAHAYPASNQLNVTNTVEEQVILDTELYDVGDNFVANEFVAPVNGYYRITGSVSWLGSSVVANKTYVGRVYKNGNGGIRLLDNTQHSSFTAVDSTANVSNFMSTTEYLIATDTIQLWVRQDSGVSTVDLNSGRFTFLEVILLYEI